MGLEEASPSFENTKNLIIGCFHNYLFSGYSFAIMVAVKCFLPLDSAAYSKKNAEQKAADLTVVKTFRSRVLSRCRKQHITAK